MEILRTDTSSLWSGEAYWPRWMGALALVSAFGVLGRWGGAAAAGFALGALVGILSYHWLHKGISTVLSDPSKKVSGSLVTKVLLRYPLVLGLVVLVFWTGWLPTLGVIAGLFVPVGGILMALIIQMMAQIFTSLRSH